MTKQDKYIRYRSCLRKKKLSKIAADWMIERIAKEQRRTIYYYQCCFCSRYHLTKKEPLKLKDL